MCSTAAYQHASSTPVSAFAEAMAQAKQLETEAYDKAVSKVSCAPWKTGIKRNTSTETISPRTNMIPYAKRQLMKLN